VDLYSAYHFKKKTSNAIIVLGDGLELRPTSMQIHISQFNPSICVTITQFGRAFKSVSDCKTCMFALSIRGTKQLQLLGTSDPKIPETPAVSAV